MKIIERKKKLEKMRQLHISFIYISLYFINKQKKKGKKKNTNFALLVPESSLQVEEASVFTLICKP